MTVKLLTEPHLEFLSLKGGCIGSSEYTLVKMSHCWKSHVMAHMVENDLLICSTFCLIRVLICISIGKKEGKDQESIQSSTTPDPGHHMGN